MHHFNVIFHEISTIVKQHHVIRIMVDCGYDYDMIWDIILFLRLIPIQAHNEIFLISKLMQLLV